MGLVTGHGLATETKPLLQSGQRSGTVSNLGVGPEDPIEANLHKFLERGFALCGNHLGSVKQLIGQIDCRLHVGNSYGDMAILSN
jgi:hypothetical protein